MKSFRHWRGHLDEMYVKINGEMVYLWRAVDHEGEILESYVTKTRDKKAALALMRKALKRHGSPEAITTDGLRSYGAAMNELGNREKQEVGRSATIGWRIATCPSDKESGPCCGSEGTSEVRLRARQSAQPLLAGTPSPRPKDLQGEALCHHGRVTIARELAPLPFQPEVHPVETSSHWTENTATNRSFHIRSENH